MQGRQAALGAGRAVQRPALPARPRASPASRRPLLALLPRRCFATHFDGFPFGGRFPGAPPPGNSEKFYGILGVDKSASEAEIKQAYKKQAMQHHPDRGGDENTFKEISRAYEVLSNPEKKQIYDAYGEEGLEGVEKGGGGGGPQPGTDPFDLFGQIFGFNPGSRRSHRGRPVTPDSTYELQVSLEELYMGTSRNIVFTRDALCSSCKGVGGLDKRKCSRCDGSGRQVTLQQMGLFVQHVESLCSACRGRGYTVPPSAVCKVCKGKCTCKEKKTFTIDIERGLQDGREFRFRGQADEAPGHDTGDVVIVVQQKPHQTFQRVKDSASLVMSKKISLSEALCGFEFSTTFLDGEDLVIRSRPGQVVRPGDIMQVRGRGMPRPHGQKPGDLFIFLDVEFPESIAPDRHEGLAELLGGRPLNEEPPANAEVPSKLTQRQAQELKQRLSEARRENQQQRECVQQ